MHRFYWRGGICIFLVCSLLKQDSLFAAVSTELALNNAITASNGTGAKIEFGGNFSLTGPLNTTTNQYTVDGLSFSLGGASTISGFNMDGPGKILEIKNLSISSPKTTITSGTIQLTGTLKSLGPLLMEGGTFDIGLGATIATIGTLESLLGGTIQLGDKTLEVTQGSDQPFSGVITGIDGNFTLASGSTSVLTLDKANTYTGTTTIDAGTLALSGAAATIGSTTEPVIVNDGTLDFSQRTGTSTIGNLSGGGGGRSHLALAR